MLRQMLSVVVRRANRNLLEFDLVAKGTLTNHLESRMNTAFRGNDFALLPLEPPLGLVDAVGRH